MNKSHCHVISHFPHNVISTHDHSCRWRAADLQPCENSILTTQDHSCKATSVSLALPRSITFHVWSLSTRKCRWHCGWFAWVLPYMESCRIAASRELDRVHHGSEVILYSSKRQWSAISNHTHYMLVASIRLHVTILKYVNGITLRCSQISSNLSENLQLLQGRQLMFLNTHTVVAQVTNTISHRDIA